MEAVNRKSIEDEAAVVVAIEAINVETSTHPTGWPSTYQLLSGKSNNLTGNTSTARKDTGQTNTRIQSRRSTDMMHGNITTASTSRTRLSRRKI